MVGVLTVAVLREPLSATSFRVTVKSKIRRNTLKGNALKLFFKHFYIVCDLRAFRYFNIELF